MILADSLLSSSDIDDDLYKAIGELEPYGEGHPSPLFALSDTLDMAKAVGQNGNTLQLRIGGIKGVAWQKGEQASQFQSGQAINAVISLRENIWQEKRSLEFIAEDLLFIHQNTLKPTAKGQFLTDGIASDLFYLAD